MPLSTSQLQEQVGMFSENVGRDTQRDGELPYAKGLDPGDDMSLVNNVQVYKYYPKQAIPISQMGFKQLTGHKSAKQMNKTQLFDNHLRKHSHHDTK